MKRVFSLLLIFVLFLTSVLAQNNVPAVTSPDPKELTGEYIVSTGYVGERYSLFNDGSFEYYTFSDCCDPVWRETGSYTLRDSVLHFKVTTKTLNGSNMLDPKQATEVYRKVYNRPDAEVPANKKRTEYDMHIVRWGERIYLLYPDYLARFVAAVNYGIEPRQAIIEESYLSYWVFLRVGDEKKAVVGKPSLPEPWLSFLDGSPIKATITNIEMQNNERIYTVDKGSADGLRVGMILVRGNETPDSDNLLVMTAVEEDSSKVKHLHYYSWSKPFHIGESMRTKPYKNLR